MILIHRVYADFSLTDVYLPQTGNEWTYRMQGTSSSTGDFDLTVSESIGPDTNVDYFGTPLETHEWIGSGLDINDSEFRRLTSNGLELIREDMASSGTYSLYTQPSATQPAVVVSPVFNVGDISVNQYVENEFNSVGTQIWTGEGELQFEFQGVEQVTVPAGTFYAMKISGSDTETNAAGSAAYNRLEVGTSYWAPDLGMIKSDFSVSETLGGVTTDTTYTKELLTANIAGSEGIYFSEVNWFNSLQSGAGFMHELAGNLNQSQGIPNNLSVVDIVPDDPGTWSPEYKSGVKDLALSMRNTGMSDTEIHQIFSELGSLTPNYYAILGLGPIDLMLQDIDGHLVGPSLSNIPGAFYSEFDLFNTGAPVDMILLSQVLNLSSQYEITVNGETLANQDDLFSLFWITNQSGRFDITALAKNTSLGANDHIFLYELQQQGSNAVPEPLTIALVGMGMMGILFKKRNQMV
jgi:hypothetical protein